MKKFLLSCMLLLPLCATGMQAEEAQVLKIHLADQSYVLFVLPDQDPVINCSFSKMNVSFQRDGEWDNMSFSRDEVVKMTIDKMNIDGVEEVKTADKRIRFDLSRGSVVRVSGLQADDRLSVVSLDGKSIQALVSRQDGEATIDLSGQPRGCYVVSVNKRFTFKLMKP